MKYRTRTYYTDAQKALMWERWKRGWTLHQIAKLFDRAHTSVQGILSASGGIRPADRHRAEVALSLAEREEISRCRGGRSIDPNNRCSSRPSCIHSQPRDQAQRWTRVLSGESSRPGRMGSRAPSQDLQASGEPGVGTHRDRQAPNAVVAGANRRMAPAYLPARREPSRVTRDHLPQPLHPGAWRLEEGAPSALEAHARHASVTASHPED